VSIHDATPIDTCLAAMRTATPEQLLAIERLIQKPTVQSMSIRPDFGFNEKNLLFSLTGNMGPNDVFLQGLIETDGSVNT